MHDCQSSMPLSSTLHCAIVSRTTCWFIGNLYSSRFWISKFVSIAFFIHCHYVRVIGACPPPSICGFFNPFLQVQPAGMPGANVGKILDGQCQTESLGKKDNWLSFCLAHWTFLRLENSLLNRQWFCVSTFSIYQLVLRYPEYFQYISWFSDILNIFNI